MALAENRPEPLRIHIEDDVRLPRRLSKILQDKIDGYSKTVLAGGLKKGRYKQLTGQIAGLREALRECEELSKAME